MSLAGQHFRGCENCRVPIFYLGTQPGTARRVERLTAPVRTPYCSFKKLGSAELEGDETLLGVIRHGTGDTGVSLADGHPRTTVHTTTREDESFAEAWHADGPKESGHHAGVSWARTADYLFGVARVPEGDRYAAGTAAVYTGIVDLIGELGYPSLARTWNYVSGINRPNADGLEVYRDFCVGRAEALDARGVDTATMPAATGIGAHGGGITCCFIAARAGERVNVENPAVLTAHRYPGTTVRVRRSSPGLPGWRRPGRRTAGCSSRPPPASAATRPSTGAMSPGSARWRWRTSPW